jgi:hypothetical protein
MCVDIGWARILVDKKVNIGSEGNTCSVQPLNQTRKT